jgi:hypothetical protein
MRSNSAASSLSKSGSKTIHFSVGTGWETERTSDGWDADIMDSLVKSAKFKSIWLFLGMFYKCRLDLRQTGMILEENTQVYAILRCTRP